IRSRSAMPASVIGASWPAIVESRRLASVVSPIFALPCPDARVTTVGEACDMTDQHTRTQALTHVRVRDCMHHGVLTCLGEDSLRHVARTMADHHVHAVVVTDHRGGRPVGVVSDLDVVTAVAGETDCTAGQAAATESLTVSG